MRGSTELNRRVQRLRLRLDFFRYLRRAGIVYGAALAVLGGVFLIGTSNAGMIVYIAACGIWAASTAVAWLGEWATRRAIRRTR